MKGLLEFKSKGEMNLWISMHGKHCKYMKVMSGFTLEERRNENDRVVQSNY